MLSIDPVNIHFHIPASDPLGRQEVHGKLRFLPDHVSLNWRRKGSVFHGGNGEMNTIELPYGQIEHVELVKKWFKIRRIILRISDPTLLKDIPNVTMGKMVLDIDQRSRTEAKKLISLIDFKRSVFILDEHEKRLVEIKEARSE